MKEFTNIQVLTFWKKMVCMLLFTFISIYGFTQNAGISAVSSVPNASAGLDVNFTNKGLLIPRVILTSTTVAAPLAAHVAGMIVYNTVTAGDVKPGPYYNNGTKWIPILLNGNTAGMQYWNGTAWVPVAAGTPGQKLQLNASNIPTWVP